MTNIIIPVIFGIICLVLLCRDILFLWKTRTCTKEVPATITGMEETHRYRGPSLFRLNVAYDWNGEKQYGTTYGKFRYDDYAARMTVAVWVEPDNPGHFCMESEKRAVGGNIAVYVALILVLCLVTGLGMAQERENARRHAAQAAYITEMEESILAEENNAG